MTQFIPITEYISYLLFSYLVGYVVLQFIPATRKPTIKVTKQSLLLSVLGIIILKFIPVLQVILLITEEDLLSFTAYSILTEFQVGIGWLYGSFFAVFLWMVIYVGGSKYLQASFLLLMIVFVGYASHSSALSFWPGLLSHSLHFLAITIWVGILLHVSWVAKQADNWAGFLRWFTPLTILLFLVTTISGFILMFFVVEPKDYLNSWVLPYGQMLLLKHLSIIPILVFALINGFLARKIKQEAMFNPIAWIQAETLILMIVFFLTGVLGTLAPPHLVNATVRQEGAAFWVEFLLGHNVVTPFMVQFMAGLEGIVLLIISALFLIMMIMSFYRKTSPWIACSFGIFFIISAYLGLMVSVIIN